MACTIPERIANAELHEAGSWSSVINLDERLRYNALMVGTAH